MKNLIDLIGKTPLVEVQSFDTGPCKLFLKLESQNPGGSIKDRIALSMINGALDRGELKSGKAIFEATAGNTGLGLAWIGKRLGFHTKLVIPDKMSMEKINHIKALGAEVITTRSDVGKGHPEYYQDLALSLAQKEDGWFVNQFANPDNPKAHFLTTAPEIDEQLGGNIDAIVVGVGSSGTMTGLTHYFKNKKNPPQIILADPHGSILADYVHKGITRTDAGSWLVEGIGEDFIPEIADFSLTQKAYSITDQESFQMVRQLLNGEGIFAGSSSGTLLAAAIKYCREQKEPQNVVSFVCDTGAKYLSKAFFDPWLQEQGLTSNPQFSDLRDVIIHRHDLGQTITCKPEELLTQVYNKMRGNDISQLPVLEDNRLVGIIDESDILIKSQDHSFEGKVKECMSVKLKSLAPDASPLECLELLKKDLVAPVIDSNNQFWGLITKMDLIHYLRRKNG